MAQKVVTELVDDLDDGPADETVLLGVDNKMIEIDLSYENAGELRDSLAKYFSKGRSAGKMTGGFNARTRTGGAPSRSDREQTQAVREWAKTNGYTVSDRGRIKAEIQAAFDAAHPSRLAAVG